MLPETIATHPHAVTPRHLAHPDAGGRAVGRLHRRPQPRDPRQGAGHRRQPAPRWCARRGWSRSSRSSIPADVRWIVLSHDDHDHLGNLDAVLDRCPNATLVASFAITGRLSGDVELPLERLQWLELGASLDLGDRTLTAVRPPMFDSPATRAFFDSTSGVLWAADSFGALVPGAVHERADVPTDLWDASFAALNSWNTPGSSGSIPPASPRILGVGPVAGHRDRVGARSGAARPRHRGRLRPYARPRGPAARPPTRARAARRPGVGRARRGRLRGAHHGNPSPIRPVRGHQRSEPRRGVGRRERPPPHRRVEPRVQRG